MNSPQPPWSWSLPEVPDGDAGASATEHYRALLAPDCDERRSNVPLGDLLGPLRPLETTPVSNWRRGAEGEQRTASILDPLRQLGWVVLHDRRLPGSGANVDHLVIGPGVHVIDSKAYRGRIKLLGDGRLWYGRTCLDEVLRILRWAAGEVADVLSSDLAVTGLDVHADLCVHGARLPRSPLHFEGVTLATPDSLLEALVSAEPSCAPDAIERLAAAARAVLPPAVRRSARS
ncbi:MAG: nuclease-related domain-containing protein [Acidimicrobiales bacterium]